MRTLLKILLLAISTVSYAQETASSAGDDTLQSWRARFLDLSLSDLSPDGRWAAVSKWRNLTSDTVMLIDTDKEHRPPLPIVNMRSLSFAAGDRLLTSGAGRAAWWDLNRRSGAQYINVRQAVLLSDSGDHAVLTKDGQLTVYNGEGKAVAAETEVLKLVTGKGMLYFVKQEGKEYKVCRWWPKHNSTVFSSPDEPEQMEMTPSGKYLTVLLKTDSGKKKAVLIGTDDGRIHPLFGEGLSADTYITLTEAGGPHNFFVSIQQSADKGKRIVELWYGNDGDLKSTESQTARIHEYAFYNALTSEMTRIPAQPYPTVVNIRSSRYFLAFNRASLQNYNRWIPDIAAYLYDTEKGTFDFVGTVRDEINVSADAQFMIYRRPAGGWMLYSLITKKHTAIGSDILRKPAFSADSSSIFFESEDGVRRFDIGACRLQTLDATAGLSAEILNTTEQHLATGYKIYSRRISSPDTTVLKLSSTADGTSSYGLWTKGIYRPVLPSTVNSIHDIKYDARMQTFIHREENYNLFPQIIKMQTGKKTASVLSRNPVQNAKASSTRRDVVLYTDAHGVPLKGLLYYPARFDPDRKYPLVVHIYQLQSPGQNRYTVPGKDSPEGFDLKALLEKGYFVYMPDILTGGSEGPGLAALNCVNRALDAICGRAYIDMEKAGLTGHSHGGYETNFIATRSNRFAAYISGSGNSDIIRSYFSYNYNFSSPYYWQFENGQYEMKMPFAENKKLYFDNNPVYSADRVTAPVLLWAGKKDMNIHWDQVMQFYVALRRYKKETVALFYPGQGHDVGVNTPEMSDLNRRILDWWDYFLQGRTNIPWIEKQMKKDAG